MPWRTQTIMDERARFVFEAERSDLSFVELCRRYHISRPTGYKWTRRFREHGVLGLENHSHRPRSCPHATDPRIVLRILELRRHRRRGAPKLKVLLGREFDSFSLSARLSHPHQIRLRHAGRPCGIPVWPAKRHPEKLLISEAAVGFIGWLSSRTRRSIA
ncbi:MAG: hypothetical protein D6773_01905 [Alphaproteobacteria bacterium]|nr:MAG: hypothetical protein D6773_01905 [Alphaproteobacteria bacterium]